MEYPSRSILNCFLSFNEASAVGTEFLIHSGLSTSVEWGKPLSIFLKNVFLICFTKIYNLFQSTKCFSYKFVKFLPYFEITYGSIFSLISSLYKTTILCGKCFILASVISDLKFLIST